MRILITNSVPLNGGDEALLRATIEGLKRIDSNAEIKILCNNLPLCKKLLPDLNLDWDIEYALSDKHNSTWDTKKISVRKRLQYYLKIKTYSFLYLLFSSSTERNVVNYYKNADLILSSAGGYIHDFYPIEDRLKGFELAIKYRRKLVIFAQSVGPFWKDKSIKRVNEVLSKIPLILLREEKSLKYLKDLGLKTGNTFVTADIAFLYRKNHPKLFIAKSLKNDVNSIVMNFRIWPVTDRESENTIIKAIDLCKHILNKSERTITFISTCQGIENYTDDSILARKIIAGLPVELRTRCFIDDKRYSPLDLIKKYTGFDAYIGMRLHGAILSMLGGTPAMGIAYEDKTQGIFKQMNIDDYYVNYDDDIDTWKEKFELFINNHTSISQKLEVELDRISDSAEKNIELIKTLLK